jgi:hypothetical protein
MEAKDYPLHIYSWLLVCPKSVVVLAVKIWKTIRVLHMSLCSHSNYTIMHFVELTLKISNTFEMVLPKFNNLFNEQEEFEVCKGLPSFFVANYLATPGPRLVHIVLPKRAFTTSGTALRRCDLHRKVFS